MGTILTYPDLQIPQGCSQNIKKHRGRVVDPGRRGTRRPSVGQICEIRCAEEDGVVGLALLQNALPPRRWNSRTLPHSTARTRLQRHVVVPVDLQQPNHVACHHTLGISTARWRQTETTQRVSGARPVRSPRPLTAPGALSRPRRSRRAAAVTCRLLDFGENFVGSTLMTQAPRAWVARSWPIM